MDFQRRIYFFVLAAVILFSVASHFLQAQEKKKPQAFRSSELISVPLVLPSTLDLQLLEAFVLMQKANAGESPAQHELGLRYLLGRGFSADTMKATFWIQKAADQHLPLAEFNLGILLMNGMGAEWNPFKAFNHFRAAAEQENPEALYVMGLLYTENFILSRSWPKAYRYFKRASELGSEPAKIAKKEMERRGMDTTETADIVVPEKERTKNYAPQTTPSDTGFSLLFIDFHRDTISIIEDTTLIREAYQGIATSSDAASADTMLTTKLDSSARSMFFSSATAGNPEALCLLGRCYERGLNVQRDIILAGVYYLRALHLDSYRALTLLWKLMVTDEFSRELELRSSKNDPDALYVWSGLTSIGFNKLLNEKQAFDLLQRAASAGHVPAMVELGLCYFTGRWAQKDHDKAIEFWSRASALGSLEAEIRLAAANVLGQIHTQELNTAFSILRATAKQGSLFSDLTLAYCYEKGIGLPQNKGEAYRIFHKALLRGSETAFRALRSMHDDIRPPDKEYQMPD
jgi:TPR repeat protein